MNIGRMSYPLGCLSSSFSTVWSTYSNTRWRRFLRRNTSIKFTRFGCFNCWNIRTAKCISKDCCLGSAFAVTVARTCWSTGFGAWDFQKIPIWSQMKGQYFLKSHIFLLKICKIANAKYLLHLHVLLWVKKCKLQSHSTWLIKKQQTNKQLTRNTVCCFNGPSLN